ncbi:MAG: hypothetical protein WC155_10220 [Candidatus Cloacimonadales bacterium]|jgi:hypothetical protein
MTILGEIIAVLLTLSIFSFLYKDNPAYRFSEYLLVGVSMGYGIPLIYKNSFEPFVLQRLFVEHKFIFIIPVIVGIMFWFRFSRNWGWLSRYPIAISMGMVGAGVTLSMNSVVLVQVRQAMIPIENFNIFLIFLGTITVLFYFFFSKAHTGAYGKFSKIGIWYMMIGFGASFGYTVMARISLLIGRLQFLADTFKGWIA